MATGGLSALFESFSEKRRHGPRSRPTDRKRHLLRVQAAPRRARKMDAFVEDVDHAVVYAREGGRCGICGLPVDADAFDLEHVLPLVQGGKHSYGNVQVAHRWCNKSKGSGLKSP